VKLTITYFVWIQYKQFALKASILPINGHLYKLPKGLDNFREGVFNGQVQISQHDAA